MRSFDTLLKELEAVSPDEAAALMRRIEALLNYEPRVGVFGKTGAGKSSLCNALFGAEISPISDVAACTRNPQEIFVRVGAAGVKLIDCPGVGESEERDEEYSQLYKKLFPELDLVLWLVKADDRALSSDEKFFKQVVRPNLGDKPLFVVLSQADKIEPFRDWDDEQRIPGAKQQQNLDDKCKDVARFFDLSVGQVVPISASEEYNLIHLVNQIIFALPKGRKFTFAQSVKKEVRSEEAKKNAEEGFFEAVGEMVGEVFGRSHVGKGIGRVVDNFFKGLSGGWWR